MKGGQVDNRTWTEREIRAPKVFLACASVHCGGGKWFLQGEPCMLAPNTRDRHITNPDGGDATIVQCVHAPSVCF